MNMQLLPAVDVAGGRARQVKAGDCDDPLTVAMRWVAGGAQWIHVVDLDRAFGTGDNTPLLREMIDVLPVPVQLSGGLDDRASVSLALSTGARRVNLASTALLDLDLVTSLVAEHGKRVVVGLDVRNGMVVSRGTDVQVGPLAEVIARVAGTGASEFLVADASRDGSRRGADVAMFRSVTSDLSTIVPAARVVASGGLSQTGDLLELAALEPDGVWGIVLGAALHQGSFTLAEALEAVGS